MTPADSDTRKASGGAEGFWLPYAKLQRLIDALRDEGNRVLGPTVRAGTVAFEEIRSLADLPAGWCDEQTPGRYRLSRSGREQELFGVAHGPGALKAHTFAPREPLLQIEMDASDGPGRSFRAETILPDAERLAILGVRACDLAALAMQDRIFLRDRFPDPSYAARRARLFLVAVGCTRSVDTCFCVSMAAGPQPREGYDLALTELDGGFIVRAGSERGREFIQSLVLSEAEGEIIASERDTYAACARAMQRSLPSETVRELLYANLEHPRWYDVASRCLSCGNCTMVCPTCFCHDVRDEPSLDLASSLRVREWDSCFNREHAQIHGVNFRPHIRERYRQWLVHKLASWIDQFGTSGCVGCGRCITWCPVGIDLTEEIASIADSAQDAPPAKDARS